MEVMFCRDRLGVFNSTFFRLWTCSMCYTYLFQNSSPGFVQLHNDHRLVAYPSEAHPQGLALQADVDDPETVRLVCSTMDDSSCGRWIDCCRAAEACCREQNQDFHLRPDPQKPGFPYSPSSPPPPPAYFVPIPGGPYSSTATTPRDTFLDVASGNSNNQRDRSETVLVDFASSVNSSGSGGGWGMVSGGRVKVGGSGSGGGGDGEMLCPRTWDGFGCFKDTAPGRTVSISCPSYIQHSDSSAPAYKRCTENGTWWRDPATNQEWTDYTSCVQMQKFRTLYYISVVCNGLSLILLFPACVIFLLFRKLREQQRIKLHVNLFLSFILTSVVLVLWENLVYSDRLSKPAHHTLMYRDTVGCKALYVLTRYAWTTNFCWMFLEGFHLHRLIVKAFEVPKSVLGYYLVGWGGSALPVLAYTVIRAVRKDSGCWVHNIEGYEWIVYTPSLLCIVVNVFFLISILRILLTQLTTHPNEPSSYRRALKATFVLVPLFGLQLFLVIYRPQASAHVTHIYDVIGALVTNSQGGLVALIFCFFNKEVLSHLSQLKIRCSRCLTRGSHDTRGGGGGGHSSLTYVLTERGGGQAHNGPLSRSPGSGRGQQYVAMTTTTMTTNGRGTSYGSNSQRGGGVAENFV